MMDMMVMRTPEPRGNLSSWCAPREGPSLTQMCGEREPRYPRGSPAGASPFTGVREVFWLLENSGWGPAHSLFLQKCWTASKNKLGRCPAVGPGCTALGLKLSPGRPCLCQNCSAHLPQTDAGEEARDGFFPH